MHCVSTGGRGGRFGGGGGGGRILTCCAMRVDLSERGEPGICKLTFILCDDIASNSSGYSVWVGLIPLLTFLCLMTLPVTYLRL